MKNPKILLATDTYFPHVDGVVRYITEIENKLNCIIFTSYPDAKKVKRDLVVSSSIKVTLHGLKFSIPNINKLKRYIETNDLVFINSFGPCGILALFLANKLKKPIISFLHCYDPHLIASAYKLPNAIESLLKPFFHQLYKKSDCLIIENLVIYSKVKWHPYIKLTVFGVDSSRFRPISEELKLSNRKLFGLNKNDFVILYSGRISHHKRVNTFLKIVDRFPNIPNTKFFVVGEGPQQQKLEQLKNNCKDLIIKSGFINDIELAYQISDIMLNMNTDYPVNQSFMEACACGLPIIASKPSVHIPFLIDNENITFSTGSYQDYISKILAAYYNPASLSNIRCNAINISRIKTWMDNANMVNSISNDLLSSKKNNFINL